MVANFAEERRGVFGSVSELRDCTTGTHADLGISIGGPDHNSYPTIALVLPEFAHLHRGVLSVLCTASPEASACCTHAVCEMYRNAESIRMLRANDCLSHPDYVVHHSGRRLVATRRPPKPILPSRTTFSESTPGRICTDMITV